MPFWMSMNLQNANSPIMELFLFFNDITMILIIMIILNLMILSFLMFKNLMFSNFFPESQSLEDLWLSIPIIFLLFIGFPSIKNLYMIEEYNDSDINLKILGHQWYWSYEIMNYNISFDSMMNKENFNFRLMETFNQLIIPIKTLIRLMVSSEDVIHSWAIPSLGIKLDATPGRISQSMMMIQYPSLLLGQCSEICGSNHSFMPILISANNIKNFLI